jgi:hypothetical protein
MELQKVELTFTEQMKGYISFNTESFLSGFEKGKIENNFFMFNSDIYIEDVFKFNKEPSLPSTMKGWIESELFGGKAYYDKAFFNLYVDTENPKHKYMKYRIFFKNPANKQEFTLFGFKDIKDDPIFDIWEDTTTLYTRIYQGFTESESDEGVIAKGILKIYMLDFLKQLTTFRTTGSDTATNLKAFIEFNKMFLGTLYDVYAPKLNLET